MKVTDLFMYENGNLINKKTKHTYYNKDRDGYIRVRVLGREYRAHRIIWEMFYGPIPDNMFIDHIDRDTTNNKIENLRLATKQQNNHNRGNISGRVLPKGVTKVGNKYRVRIMYNGKYYDLGTYDDMDEAGTCYKESSDALFGEYSYK